MQRLLKPFSEKTATVHKSGYLGALRGARGTVNGIALILTHWLELADQLLLGPLGPLLFVGVDGAQDWTTRFPTILNGRNIQIVDEHNVRVLWREESEGQGGGGGGEERGGGGLDKSTQRERESDVAGNYVQISWGCGRQRSG